MTDLEESIDNYLGFVILWYCFRAMRCQELIQRRLLSRLIGTIALGMKVPVEEGMRALKNN
jgi:hypothetical protein